MYKLYGVPLSNYYNIAKLALLEKGVAFEEVQTMPNQDDAYRTKSPVGKIPCLQTDRGCLSESSAIIEFLEDTVPSPRLYPADPWARAKTRELCRIIELYIELSARRHYPHLFFGAPKSQAAVDEVKPVMERAIAALKAAGSFKPWVGGPDFTAADIYAYYTFGYGGMTMNAIYGWDIVAEVPGLKDTLARIAGRPHVKTCDAAQQAALAAFQAQKAG